MMRFCSILMLLFGCGWRVAAAPTNDLEKLTIQSPNGGTFDMANYRIVYLGPVTVDDPRMHLTSDWLAADMPPHDKNQNRQIVALTNVVMVMIDNKGETNHATSDKAVYDFHLEGVATNETVTLSGHAKMWTDKFTATGEPLVWDLVKQELTGSNWVTTFSHELIKLTGTNVPAGHTNGVNNHP